MNDKNEQRALMPLADTSVIQSVYNFIGELDECLRHNDGFLKSCFNEDDLGELEYIGGKASKPFVSITLSKWAREFREVSRNLVNCDDTPNDISANAAASLDDMAGIMQTITKAAGMRHKFQI